MAATCPKCGYKLRLRDYKPECPQCGVNLVYYGMEERLRAEADKAELEYAHNKPKTDRIKAATIGSRFTQVRLGMYLLPILCTLIPLGTISYALPFYEKSTSLNIISLVTIVQNFDFDALLKMFGSADYGKYFIMIAVSLVCFLLMLVLSLVSMALLTLSCSPKGLVRNFTFNIVNICLYLTSVVCFYIASTNLSSAFPGVGSAKLGIGFIGILIALLVLLTLNIIQKVKPIEVKYTDVSEYLMAYEDRPSTIAAREAKAAAAAAEAAEEAAAQKA